LADAYEAVVAAIYLDGGLEAARRFVRKSLIEGALNAAADALARPDHKSALQELLQARGMPPCSYHVIEEAGPDHQKTFCVEVRISAEISASGTGRSKKEAEQAAAVAVLQQLCAVDQGRESNHE
jgi:ribonuclease-3